MTIISNQKRFIFIHIYKTAGTSIRTWLQKYHDHIPLAKHIRGPLLLEQLNSDKFKDYFKFAVVRNPWDWQVSLYYFMLRSPDHHQYQLMKSLGSFDKYIRWRCQNEVRLQKDFVVDSDGQLIVNKVAKFENLDNDLREIAEQLDLPFPEKLPKTNQTNHPDYRSLYTEETKQMVADAFKEDIEFFQYEFE